MGQDLGEAWGGMSPSSAFASLYPEPLDPDTGSDAQDPSPREPPEGFYPSSLYPPSFCQAPPVCSGGHPLSLSVKGRWQTGGMTRLVVTQ